MKNQRQWFLRVPWGKLVLVSYGHPDGEPVFLVHGRQDSSSVFEPIIEQMSNEYHYVALDMPGNGLSDAFPHVSNVPLRPGDLPYAVVFNTPPKAKPPFIEFNKFSQSLHCKEKRRGGGVKLTRFHFLYAMELALLHLGWDKFIFMGHSMGCEQGLFYNVIYPGQITKMILFDAGPTIMRMQVEDPFEYQRSYYDYYYENYHKENFYRKTYTRPSAIEALKRLRDLTDDQCSHLLRRNFHTLGNWHPIEAWHPNEASLRYVAKKPILPSNDVARISSMPFPAPQSLIQAQIPPVESVNEAQIPSDKTQNEAQMPSVENQYKAQCAMDMESLDEIPSPNEGSSDESSNHYMENPHLVQTPVSVGPHEGNNVAELDLEDEDTPTAGCSNEALYPAAESITDEEYALQGGTNEAVSSNLESLSDDLGSNEELGPYGTQSPMQHDKATSNGSLSSSTICEHGLIAPFMYCLHLTHKTNRSNVTQNGNEIQNGNETQPLDESPPPQQARAASLCAMIQHMRETDQVGYLSWDNRLKTLAPQNYGNEYYFQLFKKIPPTLLIAASDGAKNMPPNPKWRQGAKELLDKMATLDNFHRVDVVGSHDVHYTHPELVAPYVNRFLKQKVLSKL